jgi:formate hydrogenlyase subunit 3/multisubunit Na+/H+ antiporter MnhD subunit
MTPGTFIPIFLVLCFGRLQLHMDRLSALFLLVAALVYLPVSVFRQLSYPLLRSLQSQVL